MHVVVGCSGEDEGDGKALRAPDTEAGRVPEPDTAAALVIL